MRLNRFFFFLLFFLPHNRFLRPRYGTPYDTYGYPENIRLHHSTVPVTHCERTFACLHVLRCFFGGGFEDVLRDVSAWGFWEVFEGELLRSFGAILREVSEFLRVNL